MMHKNHVCLIAIFTLMIGVGAVYPKAANAFDERVNRLTENNVTAFVKYVARLSQSGASADDIQAYLEEHISDTSIFDITLRYHFPYDPSRKEAIKLNKFQYIASIANGQKMVEDHTSTIDVEHIMIDRDGQSASVTLVSTESGRMDVVDEMGGAHTLPIDGYTRCEQDIEIEGRQIVISNATCETDMTFYEN